MLIYSGGARLRRLAFEKREASMAATSKLFFRSAVFAFLLLLAPGAASAQSAAAGAVRG